MKKNADQEQRRVDQVPRQDRPQRREQPEGRDHQEQELDHVSPLRSTGTAAHGDSRMIG